MNPQSPHKHQIRVARAATHTVKKIVDIILNIALLTVVMIHGAYRSELLFPNPISGRLHGKHTFLWLLCVSLLWFVWKVALGRVKAS